MSDPDRFRVEVDVTDTGISGWVTDPAGGTRRFDGWLGLMALLAAPPRDARTGAASDP